MDNPLSSMIRTAEFALLLSIPVEKLAKGDFRAITFCNQIFFAGGGILAAVLRMVEFWSLWRLGLQRRDPRDRTGCGRGLPFINHCHHRRPRRRPHRASALNPLNFCVTWAESCTMMQDLVSRCAFVANSRSSDCHRDAPTGPGALMSAWQ